MNFDVIIKLILGILDDSEISDNNNDDDNNKGYDNH